MVRGTFSGWSGWLGGRPAFTARVAADQRGSGCPECFAMARAYGGGPSLHPPPGRVASMSEPPSEPPGGPDRGATDGVRKPRVAIVFGGRSSEHAISCVTAGSVLDAIDRSAYDVVPIGIATDGRWVLESGDSERLRITGPDQLPEVDGERAAIALLREQGGTDLVVHEPAQPPQTLGEVDVVFPLLHGPWGEDGTIQGMFEMAGVRYVGAGVLASAVGMDKAYAKIVLRDAGLPVLPAEIVTARQWYRDPDGVRHRVAELGFLLFVKPARAGSSMGISKVPNASDLYAAIEPPD